jgi:hypothetical protein
MSATVNIPKDVIEPIVHKQIQIGIVEALGEPEKLIEEIVSRALNQKVTKEGTVDREHWYNNKFDFIETVSKNAIQKAAREAIEEWVEENKPRITEQVKKALAKKQGQFARALVDGMVNAIKQTWSFNCAINLKTKD